MDPRSSRLYNNIDSITSNKTYLNIVKIFNKLFKKWTSSKCKIWLLHRLRKKSYWREKNRQLMGKSNTLSPNTSTFLPITISIICGIVGFKSCHNCYSLSIIFLNVFLALLLLCLDFLWTIHDTFFKTTFSFWLLWYPSHFVLLYY